MVAADQTVSTVRGSVAGSLAGELRARRLIAIAREPRYVHAVKLARTLVGAGVTVIEFTFTGTNAGEAIAQVKAECPGMLVGAGTVTSSDLLERAINARADFVVSPTLDPKLITAAAGTVPFIPGAFTPTEVAQARELGCEVVKIYPAQTGGVTHIRDLRSVLPGVHLVPTGGIGIDDARTYLNAGALAVGLGTALLEPGAALEIVRARAQQAVAGVADAVQRRNATRE